MLEPTPRNNLYNRPILDYLDLVYIKGDTKYFRSYEIRRLINYRTIRKGQGFLI